MLPHYTITELSALRPLGSSVVITAMNIHGTLVGTYNLPMRDADQSYGKSGRRAFRLYRGHLHRLKASGESDISVDAINAAGTAVGGRMATFSAEEGEALVWKPGSDRAELLGSGRAIGINDRGEIALNTYHFSDGESFGKTYRLSPAGKAVLLQEPAGMYHRSYFSADSMNQKGQIVGMVGTGILLFCDTGETVAKPLEIVGKRSLKAAYSLSNVVINDGGTIAGNVMMAKGASQEPHFFLWRKGASSTIFRVDISDTSTPKPEAHSVTRVLLNNREECVIEIMGYISRDRLIYSAYRWYRGVTECLPLERVYAINDRGQIAGRVTTSSGHARYVLLTP